MLSRRNFIVLSLSLLGRDVHASEDYPSRPVRIIVAYPAGSTMDVLARMISNGLHDTIGGTFVVENRPGAAGQIGAEFVAKAAPDGYTLMISGSSTHSADPAVFKKLRYDPIKDFTPIVHLASLTYALVVASNVPVKSVPELVQYAQSRSEGLLYAYGSQLAQVSAAAIAKMIDIKATGVAYPGQPPAIQDLIAGQVQFMVGDVPVLMPQVTSRNIRAIAVLNDTRSPLLPDVPTLLEEGYPGYDLTGWMGLSAPANTPSPIVNILAQGSAKVLSAPQFRDRLAKLGMTYIPGTPATFQKLVADQLKVWSRRVQEAGIVPQ